MDNTAENLDFPVLDRRELITELFSVREQIAVIEARELKDLKKRKTELENTLLHLLEVGEKASFAGVGTVSCAEEIVPAVTDWDALQEYILQNKALYLLPRKLNAAPYREALNIGEVIAGTESTTIRKLNVRKA